MEIVGKDATFTLTYGDSIIISHWAYEAMAVMVENSIMRGISEAELSPKDLATVQESIKLVLRSQQVMCNLHNQ